MRKPHKFISNIVTSNMHLMHECDGLGHDWLIHFGLPRPDENRTWIECRICGETAVNPWGNTFFPRGWI
jgi:hypothetical protein